MIQSIRIPEKLNHCTCRWILSTDSGNFTWETYRKTQEQQKTSPETATTEGFARFCEHKGHSVLSVGSGTPSFATCLNEKRYT